MVTADTDPFYQANTPAADHWTLYMSYVPQSTIVEYTIPIVFLPTGEPCPYDLLISGAFNSNLSRQEVRVARVVRESRAC